jgi:long-chain fatty acid transport protein
MMTLALPGLTSQIDITVVSSSAVIHPIRAGNPAFPDLTPFGGSGNANRPIVLPRSATVYRHGDWAFGLTTSSPYALETLPNSIWAGMFYARETRVYAQNFTPQVAYRVTPWLSIGAGLQIQATQATLSTAFVASPTLSSLTLKGDAVNLGFNAGATIALSPRTLLGLGYRSYVDQTLSGTVTRPAIPALGLPAVTLPASFTLPMPETVTLNARHRINAAWAIGGEVQWTHWSRFSRIPISVTPPGVVGTPTALNLGWRDGWQVTGGAEYRWSPRFAVRGGLRYEQSAISDQVRAPSSPRSDHLQLRTGFTYEVTDRLSLDVRYFHNFERHVPINVVPGHPAYTVPQGVFIGDATLSADFVSIGLRYYFGEKPLDALRDIFSPAAGQPPA